MRKDNPKPKGDGSADTGIAVGTSVRVYPGTDRERLGVVVEDLGDSAGQQVDIGQHHIVDAARRWAVHLSDGSLMFVDSGDISPADGVGRLAFLRKGLRGADDFRHLTKRARPSPNDMRASSTHP